ncbi:Gfo/Idh/MocA family oxidoreductase [Xanthocytophaga agilis]|uniref:Gfo/Idh/MocA family oxidoreductase n=1 Tax=Xanthocytophaga agilis TaxID=3048010 RepID=A0AAE3RBP5_9BACT|nr:Gfo/Idh/MocA family oxidoreductase [Xanthocytophaga agilis]MDJ1504518.1 Gfo/Idh/MocA family oxidoreductase [Xanthocytophaga agilis]
MKKDTPASRRKFIKQSSLALAGFSIVPRHVLGKGFVAPSDKLNIAAVGCGGKADFNIQQAFNNGTDNIVALCDVDDRQAKKYREKFPKAPYYKDFRQMLVKEKKNIDAVIVSTPDHMHYPVAMAAMQLGKHVYVEKPLTHDIWEARQLTEAAQKYKVVTQMGNQGSSGKGTRLTEAIIQSGAIGDVHTVEVWTNRPVWPQGVKSPKDKGETQSVPSEVDWNLWLGTAPFREYHEAYMPFRWRGYWDFGTGSLGDMGCHFMDVPFRALKLGYPTSVECSVGQIYSDFFKEAFFDDVCPPSAAIHLKFPNTGKGSHKEISVSWYDGGIRPRLPEGCDYEKVFARVDGGILFIGSQGILAAELFGENPKLFPSEKFANYVLPDPKRPLVEGDTNGHQQQWVKACKKGYGTYTSSAFNESGPLTEMVLMGNLAVRSFLYRTPREQGGFDFPGRKKLLWDGANMKITNFDVANQFVKRQYREGWS